MSTLRGQHPNDQHDRGHRQYLQLEDSKGEAGIWVISAYADGSFRVTHVRLSDFGSETPTYRFKREERLYPNLGAIRHREVGLTNDDWLTRAAAQARKKTGFQHPNQRTMSVPRQKKTQPKGSTKWRVQDNRHFGCRCCSTVERLTKGDYRDWQDGKVFNLTCTGCGRSGQI